MQKEGEVRPIASDSEVVAQDAGRGKHSTCFLWPGSVACARGGADDSPTARWPSRSNRTFFPCHAPQPVAEPPPFGLKEPLHRDALERLRLNRACLKSSKADRRSNAISLHSLMQAATRPEEVCPAGNHGKSFLWLQDSLDALRDALLESETLVSWAWFGAFEIVSSAHAPPAIHQPGVGHPSHELPGQRRWSDLFLCSPGRSQPIERLVSGRQMEVADDQEHAILLLLSQGITVRSFAHSEHRTRLPVCFNHLHA